MPPSLFPRLGETLGECEQERETRWRLETESPALAIVTGDTHFSIRFFFFLCGFSRFVYTILWSGPRACGLLRNPEKRTTRA